VFLRNSVKKLPNESLIAAFVTDQREISTMSGNHNKIKSHGADVVTTLSSPGAVESFRRRSRFAILAFSCVLIIGLLFF